MREFLWLRKPSRVFGVPADFTFFLDAAAVHTWVSARGKKRIVSTYQIRRIRIYTRARARDAAIDATERLWSRFRRYRPGWSHRPFFSSVSLPQIVTSKCVSGLECDTCLHTRVRERAHTHTHTSRRCIYNNMCIKNNWFRISIFYSVSAREWYIITTVIVLWMLKKVYPAV